MREVKSGLASLAFLLAATAVFVFLLWDRPDGDFARLLLDL